MKWFDNLKESTTIKYADSYVKDEDICSNYSNGMCTEEEDKQCDGCASKVIDIKNKYQWLNDKIDEKERSKLK